MSQVSIERRDGVAVISINNPPVNALSQPVREGLTRSIDEVAADDDVKAIVIFCTGRTFIAGADIREFGRPPEPPYLPDVVALIEASDKLVVAAMHGTALGGGSRWHWVVIIELRRGPHRSDSRRSTWGCCRAHQERNDCRD